MTKNERQRKVLKIILIVLVILTLAFIWTNSLLSRQESNDQSEKVKDFLTEVFTLGGKTQLTRIFNYIIDNIRKIAHFVEFAFLGGLLVICFGTEKNTSHLRAFLFSLGLSIAVAILDEMLQILSKRGSAVSDVILDASGAAFGALLITLISLIFGFLKRRPICA